MKKAISILLAAAMGAAALTGCSKSSGSSSSGNTPLVLNEVAHSIFYAPQYAAIELGYFEDEGIDLTLVNGAGADKVMTALISGDAQIGFMGSEASIYVYQEGSQDYAVNFAQLTQRAGNFLVSRKEEPDFQWSDLEGKSVIGGRLGGMPEMVLEYVIKENGMTIGKDMEIINNIDFTSTAGAFLGEVGDYTVEFEPAATTLEQSGKGHIVASLGEASGYVPYTVYMAQDAFLQAHPEVVEAFTRAIYKGQQWVESHSAAEIAKVIQPQFAETDLDTLTTIVERYQKQDTWKTDPTVSPEGFVLIQKIMMEGKELSQEIPYDSIVVTEFAEKVMTGK